MANKDYYDILGVPKTASQEEIKKAFRTKAHEHHPDKTGGTADKFKELNEAYQTLGNEQKRQQYDQFGASFGAGGGPGGFNYQDFARQQGGNPFGQSGFNQGNVNFDFGDLGDLGDIFGSFFGGGTSTRTRRKTKGEDMEIEMAIDFEEAAFGVEKNVELQKAVTCEHCSGNGAEPGSKIHTCKTCGGTGRVTQRQQTMLGVFQTQAVCPDCQGEGKQYDKKCTKCHGQGTASDSVKIKVKIPAGIENGQSIKLTGQGEAMPKGMPGDLYILVRVKPSHKFKREGDDIFIQHHISIKQAVLGDKVEVETVDGPVNLKIPEGTQSHTQFRLNSKGVPHLRSRGRGDQIVDVIVDIPRELSRQDKKIIEELDI